MAKKNKNRDKDKTHVVSSKKDLTSVSKKEPILSNLKEYYKTHKKTVLIGTNIFLILIALFLAIGFRSFTATLPVTHQWAQSTVDANVKNSISSQINQQYPNLPPQNKEQLVNQQYKKALADPATKQKIDDQVTQTATYFKSQLQNEKGQTYLLAIDPYQWLRQEQDIIDHGYPGDAVGPNGSFIDHHMLAPVGTRESWNFHTWFIAKLYEVLHAFNPSTSLMGVDFWLPVIFIIFVIPTAFFIGMRKAGMLGGFFAATLVGVSSGFLGRTPAGFADTDVFVVLMPLLAAWFFIEAFESKEWHWKRLSIYLTLMGATFGLFSFIWGYWWFFFDIFTLVMVAYIIYQLLRHIILEKSFFPFFHSETFLWWLVMFGGFLISTGIFVTIFSSFSNFMNGPFRVFGLSTDFKNAVSTGTIWPNVYTTVAELNAPSLANIIGSVGGKFFFVLSLMGMLFTLVSKKWLALKDWLLLAGGLLFYLILVSKGDTLSIFAFLALMAVPVAVGGLMLLKDKRDIDVKYAILIAAWLAASIFTMTKGVRFVLLLIPPFAISAAIAVGITYSLLKEWLVERVKLSKMLVAPVLFIVLSLILIAPIHQGYATGYQEAPSMSDAWWNSLTKIKQESQPNAIINSWWDFGHWFKYVADRAVTFDGASQTTPNAHWIGKVLLTDNESEALGILRMLDCGNYLGVEDVQKGLPSHDQYEAIMLTKRIILLPKEDARKVLLEANISSAQTAVILNHTHCDPPEDYFITSADMVGKGGVWGHFGSWDFAKADAYAHLRNKPQADAVAVMEKKYGWSKEKANKVYYSMQSLPDQKAVNTWISPWPGYGSGGLIGCSEQDNNTVCPLNIGIGQQQGLNVNLQGFFFNSSAPNESFFSVAFSNAQGVVTGRNIVRPNSIIIEKNDTSQTIKISGNTLSQAVIINPDSKKALLADELNAGSLFTKLFFFEGAGTTAFQKFSDERSFNLGRIIVWKVDWSKMKELGLE